MNIPPKADKWTVFGCTLALGVMSYARSTGLPFEPIECVVTSLLVAAFFTVGYVIWCAFCRWLARRFRGHAISRNVRAVSNATFVALMRGMIFLPVPKSTSRFRSESASRHPQTGRQISIPIGRRVDPRCTLI
jgi:hypothetical protein